MEPLSQDHIITQLLDQRTNSIAKIIKKNIQEHHTVIASTKSALLKQSQKIHQDIRKSYQSLPQSESGPKWYQNFKGAPISGTLRIICNQDSFPIFTRQYISMSNNFKYDSVSKLNLLNELVDKSVLEQKDIESIEQNAIQLKKTQEPDLLYDKFFLKNLCYSVQNEHGSNFNNAIILTKLLKIDSNQLNRAWIQIAKENNSEILFKDFKKLNLKNISQKLKPYRYAKLFCNICHCYLCNQHFASQEDQQQFITDIDEPEFDLNYSDYHTTFISKAVYEKGQKEIKWKLLYQCNYNSDYQKSNNICYLQPDNNNNEWLKVKVAKFEREFILNYCMRFDISNPCVMKFLLGTTQLTCKRIHSIMKDNLQQLKDQRKQIKQIFEDETTKLSKTKKIQLKITKGQKTNPIFNDNYTPCFHKLGEICTEDNCSCLYSRGECEKQCGCNAKCQHRFLGCQCDIGTCSNNCECIKQGRECDPELCLGCGAQHNIKFIKKSGIKEGYCKNTSMTYNLKPRVLLGKSKICPGLGLFAGQLFEKGDFIGEYVGEVISIDEANKREVVYAAIENSYIFELTNTTSIDGYYFGNKLRFVNHGTLGDENAIPDSKYVQGNIRVSLQAAKRIVPGEEILFDYGQHYKLDWIVEYNAKRKMEVEGLKRNKRSL